MELLMCDHTIEFISQRRGVKMYTCRKIIKAFAGTANVLILFVNRINMRDFRNRQVLGNIRQLDVVVPVGGIEFVGYSYGAMSGTPHVWWATGFRYAQAGDMLLVGTVCYGSTYATLSTSGYTQLALLLADDNYDCGMYVGYKIMGETPDTSALHKEEQQCLCIC